MHSRSSSLASCSSSSCSALPRFPHIRPIVARPTRSVPRRVAIKDAVGVKAGEEPVAVPQEAAEPAKNASGAKRAVLSAEKAGVQGVKELKKSLAEYMSLPASQYSVLDARKIERISDDMFKCYVGELRIFSWTAEPVLTVSVTVEPEAGGCTIRLLACELKGSKFIEDINSKFGAQMTNVVRWRMPAPAEASSDEEEGAEPEPPAPNMREIVSTTMLRVELEIPAWCSFIPASSIESVGSGVLQNVLNLMVPRFLLQLKQDYGLWAAGDTSRAPTGEI